MSRVCEWSGNRNIRMDYRKATAALRKRWKYWWILMLTNPAHSSPSANEKIKTSTAIIIDLGSFAFVSDIHLHLLNCGHGLTQTTVHHVALVPGAKVLISSFFLLFVGLVCSHLQSVITGQHFVCVFIKSMFFSPSSEGHRKCGGNKVFLESEPPPSSGLIVGPWALWKFTQLSRGLFCITAPWESTGSILTNKLGLWNSDQRREPLFGSVRERLWNKVSGWRSFLRELLFSQSHGSIWIPR